MAKSSWEVAMTHSMFDLLEVERPEKSGIVGHVHRLLSSAHRVKGNATRMSLSLLLQVRI